VEQTAKYRISWIKIAQLGKKLINLKVQINLWNVHQTSKLHMNCSVKWITI